MECFPQNGTSNGENVCTRTSPRRIYKMDHSGLSALMFPKPSSVSIGNRLGASGWGSLHIATIIFPTMRENYGIKVGKVPAKLEHPHGLAVEISEKERAHECLDCRVHRYWMAAMNSISNTILGLHPPHSTQTTRFYVIRGDICLGGHAFQKKKSSSMEVPPTPSCIHFLLHFMHPCIRSFLSFIPFFLHVFIPFFLHAFVHLFLRSFMSSIHVSFMHSFLCSFLPFVFFPFLHSFTNSPKHLIPRQGPVAVVKLCCAQFFKTLVLPHRRIRMSKKIFH